MSAQAMYSLAHLHAGQFPQILRVGIGCQEEQSGEGSSAFQSKGLPSTRSQGTTKNKGRELKAPLPSFIYQKPCDDEGTVPLGAAGEP